MESVEDNQIFTEVCDTGMMLTGVKTLIALFLGGVLSANHH